MIHLCIEDYCHNCDDFEAHVVKVYDGDGLYDTKVKCEYYERCRGIAKRIKEAEKNG